MKKKIVFLFALAGAALLFAGCSSVQSAGPEAFNGQNITASGNGVAHITGYSSGFYFLMFPLFVGSTENPDTIVFGEDSCNVAAVTKMVTKKSKSLQASKTVDLASSTTSTNIPFPFPYLFYWRTVSVSGNAAN